MYKVSVIRIELGELVRICLTCKEIIMNPYDRLNNIHESMNILADTTDDLTPWCNYTS